MIILIRLALWCILVSVSEEYSIYERTVPVLSSTPTPVRNFTKGPEKPEVARSPEPVIVFGSPSSRGDIDFASDLEKASRESISDADVLGMVAQEAFDVIDKAASEFPRCDVDLIRVAVDVALELSALYVDEPRGDFGVEFRDIWTITVRLVSDWISKHLFEVVLLVLFWIVCFFCFLWFVITNWLENRQYVALLRG